MRHLIPAALLLAGLIHLLPLAGLLGPEALQRLYGLPAEEPNLQILLRHRALLFGLLGAFLCAAAFRPAWQGPAAWMAGLSMAGFMLLTLAEGGANTALQRVLWVDAAALALLALAWVLGRTVRV
ncbi:phosphopantetheine adenylyltransferase [Inhella sp.]|uniref:phosphopantetheine adenylyltransferase n=1 Tax=Inhella sp. TaxID=1921806 RepID=UPI0035B17C58